MNVTREKNIKNKPLIISDGCCIQYGDSSALDDVTFSISEGKKVAVVGPNGGGKSTLFNAIAGLIPLAHGSLKIKEISYYSSKRSSLFLNGKFLGMKTDVILNE